MDIIWNNAIAKNFRVKPKLRECVETNWLTITQIAVDNQSTKAAKLNLYMPSIITKSCIVEILLWLAFECE